MGWTPGPSIFFLLRRMPYLHIASLHGRVASTVPLRVVVCSRFELGMVVVLSERYSALDWNVHSCAPRPFFGFPKFGNASRSGKASDGNFTEIIRCQESYRKHD